MAEDMTRVEKIHVFGEQMLEFASDETLALFGERALIPLATDDEFIAALEDIEVLFGFGMSGDHWARASKLRLIQWMGAGVDNLLPAHGLAEDVIIANASGTHEPQLPEWVIGALYSMNHRFAQLAAQQREHRWRIAPSTPLSEKTLCVIGLGTIGQSIAARARNIGMRVVGVRRSGEAVPGVERVVTPDRRLDVIDGAHAIVVITPLTDETRGLVGEEELAALHPNALFVDVSRGGVTDLGALLGALDSGHIASATLDVFETEPLPADSPLWDVERLIVTPHTSAWSPDYADRLFRVLHTNVEALESGAPLTNVVDRDRGY